MEELDGGFFAILADESADVSDKEQMALCLRFVNKKGEVCERFLGTVHVLDTSSLTLKAAIESLLMEHSLTFSQVRGQGYDGASNMQGSIDGLKTLILNECSQAYFVHCFAHQLQLTQVALAKKNSDCGWLFVDVLAPLLNFVGEVFDTLDLNKAQSITHLLMSFDIVFVAHLMVDIFGITNALNVALQKHDQDIVNAMVMVDVTKTNLQKLRDEGWIPHIEKFTSFMAKI
ncbi:zinc finger MYM-type protein 1-like [Chenopodium quinoa]|uniref:zinc finger MYM-type protein 1-like n=1 Tax=Chenopodium quinoa TaxID=63459 RepID=UPI000B782A12|nr:zinc finger MYM-type protein 1-like [Chenopodium quinoa]